MGVKMVPFQMMVYLQNEDRYVPADEVPQGAKVLDISGTELRQRLNEGRDIPAWFTYPEVVQELRRSYPPRHKQGVTIFFTGLSGSGKSTIANALITKFLEDGRTSGHAARWRSGAQEPVERTGLLQGASRHQHPPHRLCRFRDHQERRHRHLRSHRSL
jgi:signal recognition particle GTPase